MLRKIRLFVVELDVLKIIAEQVYAPMIPEKREQSYISVLLNKMQVQLKSPCAFSKQFSI